MLLLLLVSLFAVVAKHLVMDCSTAHKPCPLMEAHGPVLVVLAALMFAQSVNFVVSLLQVI